MKIKRYIVLLLLSTQIPCIAAETFQGNVHFGQYRSNDILDNGRYESSTIGATYYLLKIDPDYHPRSDAGFLSRSQYFSFHHVDRTSYRNTSPTVTGDSYSVAWRYADIDSPLSWFLRRRHYEWSNGTKGDVHSVGFRQYLGNGMSSLDINFDRTDVTYDKSGFLDEDTINNYGLRYYSVPDLAKNEHIGLYISLQHTSELEDNGYTYNLYSAAIQTTVHFSALTNISFRYTKTNGDSPNIGNYYSLYYHQYLTNKVTLNLYGSRFSPSFSQAQWSHQAYSAGLKLWF